MYKLIFTHLRAQFLYKYIFLLKQIENQINPINSFIDFQPNTIELNLKFQPWFQMYSVTGSLFRISFRSFVVAASARVDTARFCFIRIFSILKNILFGFIIIKLPMQTKCSLADFLICDKRQKKKTINWIDVLAEKTKTKQIQYRIISTLIYFEPIEKYT